MRTEEIRGRQTRAALLLALALLPVPAAAQTATADEWPAYGHDPQGTRLSPLTDITPANAARLQVAWRYSTGEAGVKTGRPTSLEATGNRPYEMEEYEETSPPAVVNDVIITGSAVADNNRIDAANGEVRGYDARTGRLRWTWDPVPQDPHDPAWRT